VYGVVPPEVVAVNVAAVPGVIDVGNVKSVVRASGLIVTVAELVAVAPVASVAVTDIESVPFVLYIVVKLAPVPDDGVPPVAVQAKVIGAVPPVAVAVHGTGLLTVPAVGQATVTKRPWVITTVADAVAVFAFPSVIVTPTVEVPNAL